ncbi:hypothetical protein MEQ_04906, partial [Candida albicans P87]
VVHPPNITPCTVQVQFPILQSQFLSGPRAV